MSEFTEIPIEGLFTELPMDLLRRSPLAWWSVKTAKEYLGVSERTIRRYIAEGKIESKYKTVKGHKRVYLSRHSVTGLADDREVRQRERLSKQEEQSEEDE